MTEPAPDSVGPALGATDGGIGPSDAEAAPADRPETDIARLDRRREEILDAAARVFGEKGFHEAGIADIATDLGIGHGTLYRYFANKKELASSLHDLAVQRIAEAMFKEKPEASDNLDEFRAQVERVLLRMFELYDGHPHLMRYFQRIGAIDLDKLALAVDSFVEFSKRFVTNGIDKGFLRPDLDVELSSQIFVACLLDLLRRAVRTPPSVEVRQRWLKSGTDMLLIGIAAPT